MTAFLPPLLHAARQSFTLRLAASFGAVFLAGILVIAAFASSRVTQLIDQSIDACGNTVATQLANSAIDATMQHDLIGLQAHLARLLKTPVVVSASVYDVQNQLLAQAGATPSELHGRPHLHHYPASIALGDNVLGRVVVTLDTAEIEKLETEIYWVLLASLALVMSAVLILSYRKGRQLRDMQSAIAQELVDVLPASLRSALPHDGAGAPRFDASICRELLQQQEANLNAALQPSPAALLATASAMLNPVQGGAYLMLHCHNLDQLQRQVSRDRLRALLQKSQSAIENASQLYGGQRTPVSGPYIKIFFPAQPEQPDTAPLHAACCAALLKGILQGCRDEELALALGWRMAIDCHKACDSDLLRNTGQATDEQRTQWLCQQASPQHLVFSAEVAALLEGQQQLELEADNGTGGRIYYRMLRFAESHQRLLDKQIEQLCNLPA